jgi:hypothetical protein
MFITIHAAVGVALTQNVINPLLAGVIGFVSHLVLDTIPHGDDVLGDRLRAKNWSRLKLGLIFGLPDLAVWSAGLIWYLGAQHPIHPAVVIAAAFGAILPDLLWGLATFIPWRWLKAFDKFHERIHHLFGRNLLPMWAGFSVQGLILAVTLLILLR